MPTNYLAAAVAIAREAGQVLREEFARPPDIAYKGDWDLVTQADKRSEKVIVSRLQEQFPGHAVAAEEGTGRETGSEFRWHVDPLDGTTNFAHGYPCFCVSIALAQNDSLVAGVVYNPIYE
jgi:myo-inositol-1(or 4)-monophosphatase